MKKKFSSVIKFSIVGSTVFTLAAAGFANGTVTPPTVDVMLAPGESIVVDKQVTTPELPPVVDVCLLEDETGSFFDDISNLQGGTTASDIYDTIVAASPGANFAVAGFRDYPVSPYGAPNDWVYRLLSGMSPVKANWLAGIAALSAGGGFDIPEAQFDAIVAAAGPGAFADPTLGLQGDCGWRDPAAAPGVQRVLVVTTDAVFHGAGVGPHVNSHATTAAALNAQNIKVIGLKAPGAGGELDALAAATGGSVQPLSSDGSNIGSSILAGIAAVTTDVWWAAACDAGLNVTLNPVVHFNVPGGTTVPFTETIMVDNDSSLEGMTLSCVVTFIANHFPEEGAPIGRQVITVKVPDVSAPEAACVETVNPHGQNVPKAGQKSPGQNEDGFYELGAKDSLDPNPMIFLKDMESGMIFGPFVNGTKIKYTEANGATPSQKEMGSNNGQAGAVDWHITGQGDAEVYATDAAGNVSDVASCLVPAPPK